MSAENTRVSNYWNKSLRDVVGLEHLFLKDCCIKHFFLLEVVNPMHVTQNTLAIRDLWPFTTGGSTNYLSLGSCDD